MWTELATLPGHAQPLRVLLGLLRLLDDDAGELDARADVELTEYLAQVGGDGVDTDINPVATCWLRPWVTSSDTARSVWVRLSYPVAGLSADCVQWRYWTPSLRSLPRMRAMSAAASVSWYPRSASFRWWMASSR